MIGGKIVEIILESDAVFLNVQDRTYPKDPRCGIYVERNEFSELMQIGDDVWWQGKWAMWTSDDRRFIDKQILRLSGSGVNHPEGADVLDHSTIVTGEQP
jgi:hypothetical protein